MGQNNYDIHPLSDTLEIREGKALELKEPKIVNIEGNIDSVFRWVEKRKTAINDLNAHILVKREELKITLVEDENNHYRTTITGKLEKHPDFVKFGINSGTYRTPFEMAELIKMNRSCFENQSSAMELVSVLKNIKSKIDKEIELSDNNRGDKKVLIDQTVKTNVPERFNLCIPVFKGQPKQTFEVEVYFKAEDITCCLVSPTAKDLEREVVDIAIDTELDRIKENAPNIVIIEQ